MSIIFKGSSVNKPSLSITPGGSIGPLLTTRVDSGVKVLVLPLKGDLYCSESVFGIEKTIEWYECYRLRSKEIQNITKAQIDEFSRSVNAVVND